MREILHAVPERELRSTQELQGFLEEYERLQMEIEEAKKLSPVATSSALHKFQSFKLGFLPQELETLERVREERRREQSAKEK